MRTDPAGLCCLGLLGYHGPATSLTDWQTQDLLTLPHRLLTRSGTGSLHYRPDHPTAGGSLGRHPSPGRCWLLKDDEINQRISRPVTRQRARPGQVVLCLVLPGDDWQLLLLWLSCGCPTMFVPIISSEREERRAGTDWTVQILLYSTHRTVLARLLISQLCSREMFYCDCDYDDMTWPLLIILNRVNENWSIAGTIIDCPVTAKDLMSTLDINPMNAIISRIVQLWRRNNIFISSI